LNSRDNCLAAGMDDYITKPCRLETLAQILEKWVPGLQAVIKLPVGTDPLASAAQVDAVIDLEQLSAYVGDDEEVRQFVITDYLKNSHERIESLRQAVIAKNGPEIKRLAHGFKAVNAFVGARTMVDILEKMEEYALKEEFIEEEHLLVSLVKGHDRVYQALVDLKQ